ncbi:MAG TPA: hypothetical protein VNO33_11470 [Kofleriaceae bacterium]|nr:hypothetical protein [Kofleriaceae bacterium]
MTLRLSVPLSLLGLAALAPAARADTGSPPTAAVEREPERANSINISPLGIVFGAYNLNYERLFGAHGLLVEAGLARVSDDGDKATSVGGSLGYRWHWRGRQNSGFLGVSAGFYDGTGEGTLEDGDMERSYDVDVTSYYLVANVGKRWAWDNGFNFTLRVGGGYGHYDITPRSDGPEAQEAAEELKDVLTEIPIAIDGELSLGYTF